MDKEGLGRALGFGARQAARTLAKVADAVTTPAAAGPASSRAAKVEPESARPGNTRRQAVRAGAATKGLGNSVGAPLARFTGVLWLEVTGSFYALFAVTLATAVWRQRGAVMPGVGPGSVPRFSVYLALTLVFAYFSISNFLRARRRGRR